MTDELKDFIVKLSGQGTLYSTPSEYVRDLLRHDAEKKMAADLRVSIIQGYQDAIAKNVIEFSGN